MKVSRLVSVCAVLAVFGAGDAAWADFAQFESAAIQNEIDSPLNPMQDFSGDSSGGEFGTNSAASNLAPIDVCIGTVCSTSSVRPFSGYRTVPLSALLPPVLGAESDLLNSSALATHEQTNIAAPYKVFRTTLHLTEGAVAAGITDANNDVSNKLMGTRLAQIETLLAAQAIPESKQFVKEYYNCVQENLATGQHYYMAAGNCRNDRMSFLPTLQIQGLNPGQFFTGTGLDLTRSPNHPRNSDNSLVANEIDSATPALQVDGSTYVVGNRLRLTDLLFVQETKNSISGAPDIGIVAIDYAQEFRQRYGDMTWSISSTSLTTSSGAPALGGSGQTAIWGVEPPEVRPEDAYQDRVASNFETLATVLHGRCESVEAGSGGLAVSDAMFFSTLLPKAAVVKLSTVGLAFSPDLLTQFMNELELASFELNALPGSNPGVNYDCDLVNPLTLVGAAGGGTWRQLLGSLSSGNGNNSLYRYMYAYSRLLALNRLLLEAKAMMLFLDSLTAGVSEGETQEYVTMAKKLVMKTLGNIDLDDSVVNSRRELAALTNSVGQRQQREAIGTGRSFSSPKQEENAS